MRRRVWQNRCLRVRERDTEARLWKEGREWKGEWWEKIYAAHPSVPLQMSLQWGQMFPTLRSWDMQGAALQIYLLLQRHAHLTIKAGSIMFIDLSQRKQSCAVYHMQMALVPYGWQWHARASNQIKTCACDVLFNLSSFHEHPCHLAAVIPFYYHGLACEQFEIIPIKLALIKMYSNKRQLIWCGEWKNSWKRNIKFICSTWWHSVFFFFF